MGSFGERFAAFNHLYFGYISYIYLFVLLYPLYKFYKKTSFDMRILELSIASFLIFFSFLLVQALLVANQFRGKFAADFADYLTPYIGVFGLWVFWFIIFTVSLVIIFDKTTTELLATFFQKMPTITGVKQSNEHNNVAAEEAETTDDIEVQPEDEQGASFETDMVDVAKEELDEPAYLRQKDNKELKDQKNTLIIDELEENKKLLADIEIGKTEKPKNFKLPSVNFLQKPKKSAKSVDESELDEKIKFLIEKLAHFKIEGDVVRTYAGPVVSTFEFKPAANVKVSKILNLQDDLAMALSAETIRIQAPIPGKDVVGIEIPNEHVATIYLRELLEDRLFQNSSSPLTIALGKDIVGKPFVTDLKKLPHLLIAGTTGSGKSVGINAMILSLLYKNSPDQLRLLMIDPKMLEFSIYNDIPHLLTPVITKPKQAIAALSNMVGEMERRYAAMADTRTKNIENYNEKANKEGYEPFPYIVVIIDELADLMMTSGKDVEHSIARLAQMARASGIHLVVATQRPSVDVVTGLIKANLPSRISYRVGQKVDSKIILDQMGAESLLGRGDMLFTPPGATGLVRLHAPWSTEEEIEKIVDFIKSQREPNYDKSFLVEESAESSARDETFEELDPLFEEAKSVILNDRKTSISYLQRKLQIGYNRSARVIEQLEQEGVLSAPNAKGIREIL
ncbi:MAG: DNA translocase FtsK [Epsilonproteobacteria bacterium]|nr:DNA translocase FtsK [Campylobacterota bacterium]